MLTKPNIDIEQYLSKKKDLVDEHLRKLFQNEEYKEPKELWEAVKYSLFNGGKRIRSALCLATYESLTDDTSRLNDCLTACASIEMIHAMSLIHDDLPAMDDDDLRRGKPSCHKAFGEATAILAGDAMLSLATQILIGQTHEISECQKLELINTLTKAFSFGLVPGQILDLYFADKSATLNDTIKIATLKTAELIKASIVCGAIVGLNTKDTIKDKAITHLSTFGLKIGVAFQIIDDILDKTSDTKTLGKTSGKDEEQKKATFPSIIGLNEAKKMAFDLTIEANDELEKITIDTLLLKELANYIVNRIN